MERVKGLGRREGMVQAGKQDELKLQMRPAIAIPAGIYQVPCISVCLVMKIDQREFRVLLCCM